MEKKFKQFVGKALKLLLFCEKKECYCLNQQKQIQDKKALLFIHSFMIYDIPFFKRVFKSFQLFKEEIIGSIPQKNSKQNDSINIFLNKKCFSPQNDKIQKYNINYFMKTNLNQNWINLVFKYKQWQDFAAKGKMRMKKKVNKDNKQYYDFDYTRYQYYYSFPDNHVGFAPPPQQKSFLKSMLEKNAESFSHLYLDTDQRPSLQEMVKKILNPLQLHEFLKQMKKQLHQKITTLRIQKTMRIKEMKGSFGTQNHKLKAIVELIEAEIRSLMHRYVNVEDVFTKFGDKNSFRVKNHKSILKSREIDELQFTNIRKTDIITYLRLKQTKKFIGYNIQILKKHFKSLYLNKRDHIKNEIKLRNAKTIKQKHDKISKWKLDKKEEIIKEISGKDDLHFQNTENITNLANLLNDLDYFHSAQKNWQGGSLPNSDCYLNACLDYEEVTYIPKTLSQLKQRILNKCAYYFPSDIIDEEVKNASVEHICYKINNLCHFQLKVLHESYDYTNPIKQRNIINIRSLLRKELQSIFSKNFNKLLNIHEHQIKCIVFEEYEPKYFQCKSQCEKESIMEYQLQKQPRFKDPLIVSFIQLLAVSKQTVVREQIYKYVDRVIQTCPRFFEYIRLYYRNLCQDQKVHLINTLNHNISLQPEELDSDLAKYLEVLQQKSQNQTIDHNLLYSYYNLLNLRCLQLKYHLLQILNAQIMCMLQAQHKINILHKCHDLPFNMSKQFMSRYTEHNDMGQNPYDFVNDDINQSRRQEMIGEGESESVANDRIISMEGKVEVRRMKPENPLFEGKSIIYSCSLKELERAMERIEFLCSQSIRRRENFLPNFKYTQIVDRIQLIYQFLNLEVQFQQAKLPLLHLHTQALLTSIHPTTITRTYQALLRVKSYNNIADLTQPCYFRSYTTETTLLKNKYKILSLLNNRQQQTQQQLKQQTYTGLKMSNTNQTVPELSSLYYVQEIAIGEGVIEEEDDEVESQSIATSENQFSVRQNTTSQLSSSFLGYGYQVKVSFHEILAKNSLDQIKAENNKKEEIINRKRKMLLNDSILGKLVPRTHQPETIYHHAYFIYDFLQYVDEIMQKHNAQFAADMYQHFFQFLSNYQYQNLQELLSPETLVLTLNSTAKYLSKLGQYAKISSNPPQHYLCFDEEVLGRLLQNESGEEMDEYRGLYLSLNYVQASELEYERAILMGVEKSKLGQSRLLNQYLNSYCKNTSEAGIPEGQWSFESLFHNPFKLIQKLKGQGCMLAAGQYFSYFRACTYFQQAYHHLLSTFNQYLSACLTPYFQLISQLELMGWYDCCSYSCQQIKSLPNITNKVYVRKKKEQADNYRVIFNSQLIKNFMIFIKKQINGIGKFYQAKENIDPLTKIKEFRTYILEIAQVGTNLQVMANDLLNRIQRNEEFRKIQQYAKLLPYLKQNLILKKQKNIILQHIFSQQNRDNEQAESGGHVFEEENVKKNLFSLNVSFNQKQTLNKWIFKQFLIRRKDESEITNLDISQRKYRERHSPLLSSDLEVQIPEFLIDRLEYRKYMRYLKFRQWLECQFLIFGTSLEKSECTKFRKILFSRHQLFDIFWEDSTKHILSTKDLSQIDSHPLDPVTVLQRYKVEYRQYIYLKKSYQNFVQTLVDMDYLLEPDSSILLLYIGSSEPFMKKNQKLDFLDDYCWEQDPKNLNSIDQLYNFMKQSNPGHFSFRRSKRYNFHYLAEYLWGKLPLKKLLIADETNRFLRAKINQSKSLTTPPINEQIVRILYKKQRMVEIMKFIGFQKSDFKVQLENFSKVFDNKIYEGDILLNPSEARIKNLLQKDILKRRELQKSKQQVMKYVCEIYFYESKISSYYYQQAHSLISQELQLRELLKQSYYTNQTTKDPLIFKHTINKMLAPKVKLNPYLSTPLKVENYFFAGTLKLSFIDQFLNRLRNRAVLIELAEGGIGFLLKVPELNDCVDALCKAVVGFSEKEFSDRFRTFLQVHKDQQQTLRNLKTQNQQLSHIVEVIRQREGKQIKSIIYEKLNDYLLCFLEKQKLLSHSFKLLRSLENRKIKELNHQYQQKIEKLIEQKEMLKKKSSNFAEEITHVMSTQIKSSKDHLYEDFKERIEVILRKNFMSDTEKQNFAEVQMHDSEILLKKLKMQKTFYQLKLANLHRSMSQRIKNLQNRLLEQDKVQNLLLMEKEKNDALTEQIKKLQKCSIQIQLLKTQMVAKQEEQTFKKFRLIKVNESLSGKVKRIQEQRQLEKKQWNEKVNDLKKGKVINRNHMSVQVEEQKKVVPRKVFKLRTQSSSVHKPSNFESQLWKEKWQKSERKFQELLKVVKKAVDSFSFSKNSRYMFELLKDTLINMDAQTSTKKPSLPKISQTPSQAL